MINDDIYLGQREKNRGCLVLVILAILALSIIFFLYHRYKKTQDPQGKPEVEQVESSEQPSSTPVPQTKSNSKGSNDTAPASNAENFKENLPGFTQKLNQARVAFKDKNLQEARNKAYAALKETRNARALRDGENLLSKINTTLLFSSAPMDEKITYRVKSGDTLGGIANKHGTTVEMLQKINGIKGHIIRIGDRLQVIKGTFKIQVSKTKNELDLYLNDRFYKRYRVGTGEYASTPVGTFKINDRIKQPTWWRPDGKAIPYGDPENLLGTHWLSITARGYGIHGTWEPESIGSQSSAGCVRMLNEEIEELFAIAPLGTEVTIVE